ncbi:MAG: hypothetical protein ACJ8AS_05945 [Hyphomicrobiales bacterium]
MFKAAAGTTLLAASAIATLAFVAAPAESNAASRSYCNAYAHQVANDAVTHRGLLGSVITAPLDVTGAVVAGRTTYDRQWENTYRRAYADCRGGAVMVEPSTEALAVAPGVAVEEDEGGSCNFSKYGSWDPTKC